jgi:putative ABC transport system permease protein
MQIPSRVVMTQACAALAAHGLRTTLAALGIIVGTATIVAVLAIGEGNRRAAYEQIGALGIDNLFVRAPAPAPARDKPRIAAPLLTERDADAIRRAVPEARAVATVRSARVDVVAAGRRTTATVVGVSRDWARVGNVGVTDGRWLTALDSDRGARVAVVGASLARELFARAGAVGQEVKAAGTWYRVVGMLGDMGSRTAGEGSIQRFDPSISLMVPIRALDVSLGEHDSLNRVEEIAVRTGGGEELERTRAAIVRVLDHDRRPGSHDFDVVVPRALLDARLRSQRAFNAFVFAIGCLTLIIGGVGIMNVMLTIVTERAPEIGLRRAVGATERDIVAQFTSEAGLLSMAGAAAGIPLGVITASIIGHAAGWPIAVSAASMLLAFGLAFGAGLASGVYPALRAARLDPVVALRAD